MAQERQPSPPQKPDAAAAEQSPLSLSRLRAAFAQMLGAAQPGAGSQEQGAKPSRGQPTAPSPESKIRRGEPPIPATDPCEINPRTVVEAMLFVGRPDGSPFSARELAAAMRGVSPAEIDAAVAELNTAYQRDAGPYEIHSSAAGHKLQLRPDLHRMRDKLHGRTREAKLTPAAVEVLSIVAYQQPTTAPAISELRGMPSGAVLQSLVRRKLVRVDRPEDRAQEPYYSTTDRFLRVFGLENIAALPRNEVLEKL